MRKRRIKRALKEAEEAIERHTKQINNLQAMLITGCDVTAISYYNEYLLKPVPSKIGFEVEE